LTQGNADGGGSSRRAYPDFGARLEVLCLLLLHNTPEGMAVAPAAVAAGTNLLTFVDLIFQRASAQTLFVSENMQIFCTLMLFVPRLEKYLHLLNDKKTSAAFVPLVPGNSAATGAPQETIVVEAIYDHLSSTFY
jgi:hypothetical protein